MSNISRPQFNPTTGARIKYADSPAFCPATGRQLVYGEDRSGAGWNQATGLPISVDAQVNLSTAGQPIAQAPVAQSQVFEIEVAAEPVSVTRLEDQGYESYPTLETAGGQSVNRIRELFRNQLSLSGDMVAIVDGRVASNNDVVASGSNVVFKEAAKRRGV